MDRAAELLDAHVAYQVARLRGPGFADVVDAEVRHALARARELTLDDAVDRADVKAVARKYVSTFALPAAIPEVVADIATRVRAYPDREVTLGDVIAREHAEAVVAKLAQLRSVREWIAVQVSESPDVQAGLADYLRSVTVDANLKLARRIPGVALGLSVGNRLAGSAVNLADQRSRELAEKAVAALLHKWRADILTSLADEDIARAALGIWDNAAPTPMSDLLAAVPDDDLVDATSILYDLWLDLRGNEYVLSLIDVGVEFFFDRYGGFGLDALLAEFGVAPEDVIEEAMRFAPKAIAALDERGLLDDLVRRQLAGFYESPQAQAILA